MSSRRLCTIGYEIATGSGAARIFVADDADNLPADAMENDIGAVIDKNVIKVFRREGGKWKRYFFDKPGNN